ncbi:MAG TPA: DNA cytosine methyltransferase [Gemmatimonadales bacterium]
MSRSPVVRLGLDPDELIIDSFAGGGGASEGIRLALGRDPDVAINHDAEAIALHKANHPGTKHYCENVWKVDPEEAADGRPIGLMWLSPDCKHFSKAKGGKPVEKKIRGLAWLAVRWASLPEGKRPRCIFLENVEEFQGWGPVLADGKPCPVRKGKTFRAFVRKLERLGYRVEWREMRACDFGAPTIRKRLFLIARCDGQPIVWPQATHGKHHALPWRTAAECIDWSIPCPSIFDRKKPLAANTLRRIARGLDRFVINSPKPFIVNMAHGGKIEDIDRPISTIATEKGGCRALTAPVLAPVRHADDNRRQRVDDPMPTITASQRGEIALAGATLVQTGYGERDGQAPRALDPEKPLGTVVGSEKHGLAAATLTRFNGDRVGQDVREPLGTVVASTPKHGVVAAFLAKHYSETHDTVQAASLFAPTPTVTAVDHNALVAAHLTQFNGTSDGQPADKPLPSITAHGWKFAEVRAFLVAYYGNEKDGGTLFDPMRTVTSKDRLGLVAVEGIDYEIADIGMRMLAPRELYNAQGFRPDYRIDIEFNGKPLTKTAQVRMVGNSVCPPMAAALIRANFATEQRAEVAA